MESDDRPHFEAVSASKHGVEVWYHHKKALEVIPLSTFKRDCVNHWKVAFPLVPLKRGERRVLKEDLPELALKKGSPFSGISRKSLALSDFERVFPANFKVRSVCVDYASILFDEGSFFILPANLVLLASNPEPPPPPSRWEHLEEDDLEVDGEGDSLLRAGWSL